MSARTAEQVEADLASVRDALAANATRQTQLLARRRELFQEAKALTPPLSNRRLAEGQGISATAVIAALKEPDELAAKKREQRKRGRGAA